MSIKKILMLASMALAAIAFAAPASALAAEDGALYHFGTEPKVTATSESDPIELTGDAEFTSAIGGIRCEVHATLVFDSHETLTVTTFNITTETCAGFEVFTGCKVVEDEAFTPWDVTVTTEDFDIQNVGISNHLANCGFGFTEVEIEFENVTAEPLKENLEETAGLEEAIYGVELSGEGEGVVDGGDPLPIHAAGTLEAVGSEGHADPGTYAFEHTS